MMIAKIEAGESTADEIIKNISNKFKINKKVREQIKQLGER